MPVNKWHSTVTRRDFMKALGFGAAGLGALAATSPVFHDLDEVLSAPESNWSRPWWVKENEIPNMTQEMDWNIYDQFDYDTNGVNASKVAMFGAEHVAAQNQNRSNREAQCIRDNVPGYDFRGRGLYDALTREGIDSGFLGYRSVKTYKQYGQRANPPIDVPRYQGTPEENVKMLRVCAKLRGAAVVGACEVDSRVKKMFFKRMSGKYSLFEEREDGEVRSNALVCPNKAKYVLTLTVPMSEELIRRMPTALAEGAVMMGYSYGRILNAGLSNYLWMLGYLGLGAGDNTWKVHSGMAVYSGCGEASRMHQNYISPELGAMQRCFAIVTDLPLAPTNPVDFGIWQYCRKCKKCAQICPPIALDRENEDPSWESPYFPFNQPGQNCYPFSFALCSDWWSTISTGCGMCMASCPFSHKQFGTVHDMVNILVSKTSFFNGFLKNLDDVFGYGMYEGVYQIGVDPMDYVNVTQEMADFYNKWWDEEPKIHGMYNTTKV